MTGDGFVFGGALIAFLVLLGLGTPQKHAGEKSPPVKKDASELLTFGEPNPKNDLLWVDSSGNMAISPSMSTFVPLAQGKTRLWSVPSDNHCRESVKRNARYGYDTLCIANDNLYRALEQKEERP